MSSLFREYSRNFTPTRALFNVKLGEEGDSISLEPLNRSSVAPNTDDPVEEVVCAAFSENFNGTHYVVQNDQIFSRAMSTIKETMGLFIERNAGYRNAKQSKVYQYIKYNSSSKEESKDGIIMLYRYLRLNGMDDRGRFPKTDDNVHITNALAILEAMRDKYEES